jgi:hypothetical protein
MTVLGAGATGTVDVIAAVDTGKVKVSPVSGQ